MKMLLPAIAVALGIVFIRYRAWIARRSVTSQNRTWGFGFDERHIRLNEMVLLIMGFIMFLVAAIAIWTLGQ
jgi:hypothetical protein